MVDEHLPVNFRKSPPYSVSFNWEDVTTGAGYIRFYGVCSMTDSGQVFFLSTRQIDSSTGVSTTDTGVFTTITGNGSQQTAFTMDITINVGMTIAAANAIIQMTTGFLAGASDRETVHEVSVNHVRGATVTELGHSHSHNLDPGAFPVYTRDTLRIALTEQIFAKGDILRLIVKTTPSNTKAIVIYHDPTSALTFTDRVARTIGTDLTLDVPFKVET